jgi:hypothetical protein
LPEILKSEEHGIEHGSSMIVRQPHHTSHRTLSQLGLF